MKFVVKNKALAGSVPTSNPAGLLYKLTINGNCGAEYFQNHCSLWQEKDLGVGDTFFKFDDVKPGDFGTDVISLHVYDNDAYACLLVGDKDDQENSLLAPEIAATDAVGVGNPTGKGELSNFLNVFTWGDDGDVFMNQAKAHWVVTALIAHEHHEYGLIKSAALGCNYDKEYWSRVVCRNMTANPTTGVITCDGNGMGNIAQSDSFVASLTAYAEQVRNNPTFRCSTPLP